MKKLLLLSVFAIAVAVPAVAQAHTLNASTARSAARTVCERINNVDASVNPYVCNRTGAPRRRSAHVLDIGLSLRDPSDGERCVAYIRVRLSRTSNRARATRLRTNCLADPYAGTGL